MNLLVLNESAWQMAKAVSHVVLHMPYQKSGIFSLL